jgi:sugar phosphate isomerase/epimerase
MYQKKMVFAAVVCGVVLLAGYKGQAQEIPPKCHPATDAYDGWRLGTQAYTFRMFSFYDAVDKAASLGLCWIEAYPGQQLSSEKPDVKMNHEMPAELRQQVKKKLAESGVTLVNYGVVRLPDEEADCRKVFDFAKDMGIETIVAEPTPEAFDLVERLCKEYGIKVAIHNHPRNSMYWNPDKVLEVCRGRSKWIGACADTGHWMRSGVDPLEAIKKLEGRIVSLHFKDLNEFGERKAHDVVWGTGKANVEALLKELRRQGFEGVFSIEYEHNWDNSVPEIQQCVEYFDTVAGGLKPTGWKDLVAKDLSNCTFKPGSWAVEDGVLTRKGMREGRSDIWTNETYGDFILDVQFKVTEHTNSGIFLRTGNVGDPVQTGIEVQVADSHSVAQAGTHDCGAVYDCLAPTRNMAKPPDEWNRCTITCKANKIYVLMNGEPIIDMDLNLWAEPGKNPDETKNKYKNAFKDRPRVGHIGFQDHGHPVWYRNMRIKPL